MTILYTLGVVVVFIVVCIFLIFAHMHDDAVHSKYGAEEPSFFMTLFAMAFLAPAIALSWPISLIIIYLNRNEIIRKLGEQEDRAKSISSMRAAAHIDEEKELRRQIRKELKKEFKEKNKENKEKESTNRIHLRIEPPSPNHDASQKKPTVYSSDIPVVSNSATKQIKTELQKEELSKLERQFIANGDSALLAGNMEMAEYWYKKGIAIDSLDALNRFNNRHNITYLKSKIEIKENNLDSEDKGINTAGSVQDKSDSENSKRKPHTEDEGIKSKAQNAHLSQVDVVGSGSDSPAVIDQKVDEVSNDDELYKRIERKAFMLAESTGFQIDPNECWNAATELVNREAAREQFEQSDSKENSEPSYQDVLKGRLVSRGFTFEDKYAISPSGKRTYVASTFTLLDLVEESE